jgi:hypothetical protein
VAKTLNGIAKLSGEDALFCLDFHDALGPESITGCLGASVGLNTLGNLSYGTHLICNDLGLLVFKAESDCSTGATVFNRLLNHSLV